MTNDLLPALGPLSPSSLAGTDVPASGVATRPGGGKPWSEQVEATPNRPTTAMRRSLWTAADRVDLAHRTAGDRGVEGGMETIRAGRVAQTFGRGGSRRAWLFLFTLLLAAFGGGEILRSVGIGSTTTAGAQAPESPAPKDAAPKSGAPPAPPAAELGPPPKVDLSRAFVVPFRKPSEAEAAAVHAIAVDDIMDQDPLLVLPGRNFIYSKALKPLWLKALARPDAETRRLAADTFSIAVARGFPDLADAGPALVDVAVNDKDPVTRRAAARAAIALETRSAAAALWKVANEDGLLMAQIVEPALARWKFVDAAAAWRNRLERPDGERAFLLLAIECVALAGDAEAVDPLLKMASDALVPAEVRAAAAAAAGKLKPNGLADTAAAAIAQKNRPEHLGRLVAALLLRQHRDDASRSLLTKLAADSEPAVAAAAIASLWATGREHALPFAAPNIASSDANLRRLAAELLCEEGTAQSIALLGPMLDDRNPAIRRFVASRFVRFANQEDATLRKTVVEQSTKMLASDTWRGLEQAALVLGSLDHEPAAERLVELLPYVRGEVRIAAGWALRRLKVAATYPAILAHAVEVEKTIAMQESGSPTTKQLSQIFQLFGEVRYVSAESLMRKFVPKSPLDQRVRGAAVWSLGYLYLDNPKSNLPKLFAARLADNASPMPELDYVRQMAGIGLGRMRAESELETLRRFAQIDGPNTKVGRGCGWSIERMTGEKMPPGTDRQDGVLGWFLESLQAWNLDE